MLDCRIFWVRRVEARIPAAGRWVVALAAVLAVGVVEDIV